MTCKAARFHKELIDLCQFKRVAIAAPRSFAKSFYYSFFYPLYLALTQEKVNILIISATATLAETWLRRIKYELESNEAIIDDFGKQVSPKWTESEIVLANGNAISAKGAGCQVRGFRYTHICVDDIEDDEHVKNELQREKLSEWMNAALIGTMESESQLVVIGTLIHPFSLLKGLLERKDGWETRVYKAICEDGSALWPEKWSLQRLAERKKEIGSIAFASEYMNTPVLEGMTLFKASDILTYRDGEEREGRTYLTVDLAISEKESADFTVVLCANRTETNDIYVLDYIRKHILPADTIKAILDMAEEYKPVSIGIEVVGYQKALMYGLVEEMRKRGKFYRIEELKGDKDKYRRISGLVPYFENHKIYVHEGMKELIEELTTYPATRNDDLCDSLAYQLAVNRPRYEEDIVTIPVWGDEGKRRVGAY